MEGKAHKMKKNTSFRLYLSGSMSNRLAEHVSGERQLAVDMCGKAGIYAVDPGASEQKLWQKKKKIAIKFPPKIMRAFITQDLWLIRHCDAILVLTGDTPSDGTWWEMTYAKQIGIPVIMIAPRRATNQLVGWSNFLVDDLVSDLKSAIRVIERKYVTEKSKHEQYFKTAIRGATHAVGVSVRKKKQALKKRVQKLEAKKIVKQVLETKASTPAQS